MLELGVFLSLLAGGVLCSLLLLAGVWWRERSGEGLVQVLVLGDAGRSPRMQYHCLSLLQCKYRVELVAYGGEWRSERGRGVGETGENVCRSVVWTEAGGIERRRWCGAHGS